MRRDEYRQVVLAEKDRVHTYAAWLLRNRDDAGDVAQEALVRLWEHHERIAVASARAWLLKTAHRLCLDCLRRRNGRSFVSMDELRSCPAAMDDGTTSSTFPAELRHAVARAMSDLSANDRAVIVLREIVGLSYDEIGKVLNKPPNNVKVTLHRARDRLRRRLTGVREKP